MTRKPLLETIELARNELRRFVSPLIGFPGLSITGCAVKQAQQNYGEHFRNREYSRLHARRAPLSNERKT